MASSPTLATSAEDFRFRPELLGLGTTSSPVISSIFIAWGVSTATLEEARERVRSADTAERLAVAADYAERVRSYSFVREIWFSDRSDGGVVTVIVEGAALKDELHLEAIFTSVVVSRPAFRGYLRVYANEDGLPASAREGALLHS